MTFHDPSLSPAAPPVTAARAPSPAGQGGPERGLERRQAISLGLWLLTVVVLGQVVALALNYAISDTLTANPWYQVPALVLCLAVGAAGVIGGRQFGRMGIAGQDPARQGLSWALAWAALVWEGVWPALMPLAMVAVGFLALALSGLLLMVGPLVHLGVLVVVAAAAVFAAVVLVRRVRLPDADAVARRLERDSALTHRPLATLEDELPAEVRGNPLLAAIWRRHQQQAAERVRALTVRRPLSDVDRHDPAALRYGMALVLLVAVVAGAGDWRDRVRLALVPDFAAAAPGVEVAFKAWVTPPAYTGLQVIFPDAVIPAAVRPDPAAAAAEAAAGQAPAEAGAPGSSAAVSAIDVPVDSLLQLRVSGRETPPEARVNGAVVPFVQADPVNFELDLPLTADARVQVLQGGRVLGDWRFAVRADQPPSIAFTQAPEIATEEPRVRYRWQAEDDYGIASATATLALATQVERPQDHPPLVLELPVSIGRPRQAEGTHAPDLVAHPWAGLPVTLTLQASDGADQTASAGPESLTLPARDFTHPVARFIIDQRRLLTTHPESQRVAVGGLMLDVAAATGDYGNDTAVFLALSTMGYRLMRAQQLPDIAAIQDMMWHIALRLEDGRLGTAQERLAEAQANLREALRDPNTTEEELERLMRALEDAMAEVMSELNREMAELWRDQEFPELPEMDLESLDVQDMEQMLDELRNQAENGDREQAQQMLQDLEQMMQNMRPVTPEEMQQMMQAMQQQRSVLDDLEDLADQQQALYDQTFTQSQDQEALADQQFPFDQGFMPFGDQALTFEEMQQLRADAQRRQLLEALEERTRQRQALQERLNALRDPMARPPQDPQPAPPPSQREPDPAEPDELADLLEQLERDGAPDGTQPPPETRGDQGPGDQAQAPPSGDPAQAPPSGDPADTDPGAEGLDMPPSPLAGPFAQGPQPGDAGPQAGPGAAPEGIGPDPLAGLPERSGLPPVETQNFEVGQQGLRYGLTDSSERAGAAVPDLPQELADADSAMRMAERALTAGDPTAALEPQAIAEQKIREAIEKLREQMQQQQQQGGGGGGGMARAMPPGMGGGGPGGRFLFIPRRPGDQGDGEGDERRRGAGRRLPPGSERDRDRLDPFGRRLPADDQGTASTEDVGVPEEAERARAREILEELRRRAGEFERPRLELEYIERLLRRF